MRVAVLGIGTMGHAVAVRLLDYGHAVTVWNRHPQRTDDLPERGARVAIGIADAVVDDGADLKRSLVGAGWFSCRAIGKAHGGGVGGVVDGNDLAAVEGDELMRVVTDLERFPNLLRVCARG